MLHRSVGALADLYDLSCLQQSDFNNVTDRVYQGWKKAPEDGTTAKVIQKLGLVNPLVLLGQHYFIKNGDALSPEWDFTSASEAGNDNAFVVGSRTGGVHAPENPAANVDWLSLKAARGDLASQIFRVETRGGQPPASVSHRVRSLLLSRAHRMIRSAILTRRMFPCATRHSIVSPLNSP